MLKDLINIERIELSADLFKIYFVKKYLTKAAVNETFVIRNPAVLLMKSGTFKMQLREVNEDLKAHDLLLMPKDTTITQVSAGTNLQFFLIAFWTERNGHSMSYSQSDFLSKYAGSEAVKITLEESDYRVLSLICRLLYAEINMRLSTEYEIKLQQISLNLLLFELNLINMKYLSATDRNHSRSEILVLQFLSTLSIHCRKHHNVKFYAGVLYVSPQYLGEVVKKETGKSAKKIINEAVLSEIIGLLENPNYSMAEIVEQMEFSSVTSFSIFFKKAMACTPSQYRKNTIERFKTR